MKKKLLHLMVYLGLLGIVSATLLGMHAEEILEPEIAQDPEIQELQKNVSQAQDAYETQILSAKKIIRQHGQNNENIKKDIQSITENITNDLLAAQEKLQTTIADKRTQLAVQKALMQPPKISQELTTFTEAMRPEPKLSPAQEIAKEEADKRAKAQAEAQAKASAPIQRVGKGLKARSEMAKAKAKAQIESQESGLRTSITNQETTKFNQQLEALKQQMNNLKLNEEAQAEAAALAKQQAEALTQIQRVGKGTKARNEMTKAKAKTKAQIATTEEALTDFSALTNQLEQDAAKLQIESQEKGQRANITDQETTEFNQQLEALQQRMNDLKLKEKAIAAQKELSEKNEAAISEGIRAAEDTEAKIAILKQTRLFPKESSWMDRLKQWLDGFIARLRERFSRNR